MKYRWWAGSGICAAALAVALLPLLLGSAAPPTAVAEQHSAVRLEPFPAVSWSPKSQIEITTVQNYYGTCGTSVVQVLGVMNDGNDFFSVDAAADNAQVVVLGEDPAHPLIIKDFLSDYNGVACVGKAPKKRLLIWQNCGGTACGDDFIFQVVDIQSHRVIAGAKGDCDEKCAARATGSSLPIELNKRDD